MTRVSLQFSVNGHPVSLETSPGRTLLDLLREDLKLTGTKHGCGIGECGACTVLLDGKPVNSCLTLAAQVDGRQVETVEGLSRSGRLHPLQEAFLKHHALQCGFCTPGVLLSAKALLDANPDPTEKQIREAISGNLCRCTGYEPIVEAIKAAAKTRPPDQGR